MNKDELKSRTKSFALRIIRLADALPKTTSGRNIANQIIRSGTSVAANYRAAQMARSKSEFISKIGIVIEEADESVFWLELVMESDLMTKNKISGLYKESQELLAIFCKIKLTSQTKDKK